MVLAAVGMTCLGTVICYLSMYFVRRFKTHTVAGLGGVVTVLLGGVVGKFLADNTSAGPDAIWWYPIGLVVGLVAWLIMGRLTAKGVFPETSYWMGQQHAPKN